MFTSWLPALTPVHHIDYCIELGLDTLPYLIMATYRLAGHRPLCFTADVSLCFSFLPRNLGGRSADHHQTLPHVHW